MKECMNVCVCIMLCDPESIPTSHSLFKGYATDQHKLNKGKNMCLDKEMGCKKFLFLFKTSGNFMLHILDDVNQNCKE